MESITIQKKEEKISNSKIIIDEDLYQQLVQSIEDMKLGRMRRVK